MNINGYDLDKYQLEAIKCSHKATLVSAGAGSGKTLTILGKIKYLIEELNYKEEEILCISFTNKSVNDLQGKLTQLGYNKIVTKTFHKLSISFLDDNVNIIDDDYLDYIIDEYFKSYIYYDKKKYNGLKRLLYKNDKDIFKLEEYKNLKVTIKTFINLAKSNDYNLNDIYSFYKKSLFYKTILKYIMEIMIIYKRELESMKKVDLNDLISYAAKNVFSSNINYKYIIIDEFQDTSPVRFGLIKNIIEKCNAKIFVVGDDWQSIYRFSGCNLDIFVNFKDYYKDTAYYSLKYTYRFSKELCDVSASFIQKNKYQLKKNIMATKSIEKPIIITYGYNIKELLKIINSNNILIIGRNNADIENIEWENTMTIHKAKGLECDNVILVNSDNIPQNKFQDKVLKYILNNKDYLLFDEERRLFYVALTRTKNYIYIMVNKKTSIFVKELIRDYPSFIEIKKKY